MSKYDTEYKVIMSLRSYKSDTNKYKVGDFVTIKDLENISFDTVLKDLNGRLHNVDFLGTDLFLEFENEDVRAILNSYNNNDLIEDIRFPGILKVHIDSNKVEENELNDFRDGVLEIVKANDGKVLALAYKVSPFGKFKLLGEDKKHKHSIIIEFVVMKLKAI
ncbi:MAG: hypothetical protein II309_03935 [Bacilli bacterium]|jgi:hypothetical protein|nr:hypothetical protein [Bacilli bacterium]